MRLGLQTLKRIPGEENVRETCMKIKVLDLGIENVTWISNDKKRAIPVIVTVRRTGNINEGRAEASRWQNWYCSPENSGGWKRTPLYFEESCQCENGRNPYYFTVRFINFLNYTLWLFKLPTSNLQEPQKLEFQSELGNLHCLAVGCV